MRVYVIIFVYVMLTETSMKVMPIFGVPREPIFSLPLHGIVDNSKMCLACYLSTDTEAAAFSCPPSRIF